MRIPTVDEFLNNPKVLKDYMKGKVSSIWLDQVKDNVKRGLITQKQANEMIDSVANEGGQQ